MDDPKPRIEPMAKDFQRVLTLSPSGGSGGSSCCNSPEFEFWMVRNPSCPQPNILSADELFADGVLLPLHCLPSQKWEDPPDPNPQPPASASNVGSSRKLEPESEFETGSDLGRELVSEPPNYSSVAAALTGGSKRWKDIFKKSDRKILGEERDKEKKRERKSGGGGGASSAELNINIWPFSRSRSAGNGGSRPKMAAGTFRKVSSAPCSRSNSAGESNSRKWPSSPSRVGGVHLGRSSPVWQARRGGPTGRSSEPVKVVKKEGNETRRGKVAAVSGGGSDGAGARAKGLGLNVPRCIGYRHHLSCRSGENSLTGGVAASTAAAGGAAGGQRGGGSFGNGGRGSNTFNLRSLFSKKVY